MECPVLPCSSYIKLIVAVSRQVNGLYLIYINLWVKFFFVMQWLHNEVALTKYFLFGVRKNVSALIWNQGGFVNHCFKDKKNKLQIMRNEKRQMRYICAFSPVWVRSRDTSSITKEIEGAWWQGSRVFVTVDLESQVQIWKESDIFRVPWMVATW